ncbi:peptidoglycan DL-endopeptidase CwlO [Enterococcus sp. AZ194]|uniref:C40 family peptidase n=1 Tax=Enterococcus sp. AZ194 TaxID=2774629 RepID=UPI003F23EFD0
MKKSLLSTVMICSLALTTVASPLVATADSLDDQIAEQNQKISDLQNQQADVQSQISSLQAEVDTINGKAEDLLAKQKDLFKKSDALKAEIENLKERIAKREDAITSQARDVQVNGGSSNFIDAVLNADSFTDAIGRVQAMNTIVQANNDLVEQQKQDKEDVEAKQAENKKQLEEIAANQAELENQKGELIGKQADLNVLTTTLAAEQATAEDKKSDLNKQKEAAIAEQKRVQEEAKRAEEARAAAAAQAEKEAAEKTETPATPSTEQGTTPSETPTDNPSTGTQTEPSTGDGNVGETPSTPTTPDNNVVEQKPTTPVTPPAGSGTGAAVVAEAYKYIGVPYVWGGKTPSGFDCSGFTSYVYRQATGREIGGWTVPQESAGTRISINDAQPGDLLFWGPQGGTHHVAIALGGGQYIHAPQPGENVKIGSYAWYAPDFAVRM